MRAKLLRIVTNHAFDRQTDGQTEFSSLDCVCSRHSLQLTCWILSIMACHSLKRTQVNPLCLS